MEFKVEIFARMRKNLTSYDSCLFKSDMKIEADSFKEATEKFFNEFNIEEKFYDEISRMYRICQKNLVMSEFLKRKTMLRSFKYLDDPKILSDFSFFMDVQDDDNDNYFVCCEWDFIDKTHFPKNPEFLKLKFFCNANNFKCLDKYIEDTRYYRELSKIDRYVFKED